MRDPKLEEIARTGRTSRKSYRNISRNFHRYVDRKGLKLPVKISWVPLWVRQHRPKVVEVWVEYPMISLKNWASFMLAHHSRFVLGGFSILEVEKYTAMYSRFWTRFSSLHPQHPFYQHHPEAEWGRCIPYALHGDEGRGKSKSQILIQSYQMIIGSFGEESTNLSGHLGYHRLEVVSSNVWSMDPSVRQHHSGPHGSKPYPIPLRA